MYGYVGASSIYMNDEITERVYKKLRTKSTYLYVKTYFLYCTITAFKPTRSSDYRRFICKDWVGPIFYSQ